MNEQKDVVEIFKMTDQSTVFHCPIFRVNSAVAHTADGNHTLNVFTFSCADWVNVVPITSDGKIILVEQHRFGTDTAVLEVPGGAVSLGEKDTTLTALRELEEETGFTSTRILSLAGFSPNPALQDNRISYFLALNCQPVTSNQVYDKEPFEKIRLHFVEKEEAIRMARCGMIGSSLSALAILLAAPYFSTDN